MAAQTNAEPQPPRSVPRTARERARAEITGEILKAGRRHLATDGAAGLSLRAIARDLGMASSAVYRYVASRDDLLTRLIIDAYDALGAAAEAADRAAGPALAGRWAAICGAVRDWALANPNEYALIYGSPVPGYVAPAETVGPGQPGVRPADPDPDGCRLAAAWRSRRPLACRSGPPGSPRSSR